MKNRQISWVTLKLTRQTLLFTEPLEAITIMMTVRSAAGINSMRLTKTSGGMLADEMAAQWV